ncbi:MAG: FlgD immunoglobulin-like domain containing protein [Candidatus Eisenbacteria bacterium]
MTRRWMFLFAVACAWSCAVIADAAPHTTGVPRLNNAYRLLPTPDMPEWAKLLYRDDVTIDVAAIDRAYAQWKLQNAGERAAEATRAAIAREFHENRWEVYYERWRRDLRAFESPDGSFDFARTPDMRTEGERLPAARQNANSTTWAFLGPERILTNIYNDPAQPLLVQQANVYSFDVSPQVPSLVYAGTETGVLSKSENKGLTWSTIGVNNSALKAPITSVAINPVDTTNVYVATTWGVVRTGNGGTTWTIDLNRPTLVANDLKVKPDSSAVVMVAGDQLMRRTGASSWATIIPRPSYDVEFRPTQPSVVYALVRNAAGNRCEFFKSTDGGLTFSIRQTGWLGAIGDGGGRLSVTLANPSLVYAVVLTSQGTRVLRSRDSGESWTVIGSSRNTGDVNACAGDTLGMSIGQGYYDLSIAASATDTNSVIVGGTAAYRTTNGGAIWRPVGGWQCGDIPIHPDIQEFKCVGNDCWSATDGGLMLSTDFWATKANATPRTEKLRGTQIWGLGMGWNEDVIIASAYHNGVFARRESWPAGTFLNLYGGEPASGYVNPGDPRLTYCTWARTLLPDTPAGSYTPVPSTYLPNESYVGLMYSEMAWDPRDASTYLIGLNNMLLRARNGGTQWEVLSVFPVDTAKVEHIEISRSNPDVIYYTVRSGDTGELYRSANGGRSFVRCTPPVGPSNAERIESTISLSGTDENTIWWAFRTGFSDHKVYQSTDGGQTWTNWSTNGLVGYVVSDMVHQLGTDGGVYLSCDDGHVFHRNRTSAAWTEISTGLPWQLNSSQTRLGIQYKVGKLRLATAVGIYELDLVEPSATLVQPMMLSRSVCLNQPVKFESYSVTNGPATYQWSFDPPPVSVDDPARRDPTVVFGSRPGPYHATLTVTDASGQTTRTVRNIAHNGGAPRWADSVLGISSEYSGVGWAAYQALGAPDVYPAYGDIGLAWASLTPDDQQEYLRLHFPDAAPIDYVQVVETFHPGSLVKVSARNPNTNQFETLWQGAPSVQPDSARAFTVRFPVTSYNVEEVRLDFDSPAVPDWNEVDAIGIGLTACGSDVAGVIESPKPRTGGLVRWARPNPFTREVEIAFTLSEIADVRAEIFDVTGKRVRVLADGMMSPGQHEARWDGRDREGNIAAPGLYYVRVNAGTRVEVRKLVKM